MTPLTLRVIPWDAERPEMHSHAERGNDQTDQIYRYCVKGVLRSTVILAEQCVIELAVAQNPHQLVVLLQHQLVTGVIADLQRIAHADV